MALRTCENCERTIGNLEPEHTWDGHAVCGECHRRLAAARQGTAAGEPAAAPVQTVVLKRPKKPGVFWLAIALFCAGSVLIGVEMMRDVSAMLGDMGDAAALERRLAEAQSDSAGGTLMTLLSLPLLIAHVVGFLAAWRGHAWGSFVMVGTAVPLVAMEFTGGSIIGVRPTVLYIAGFAVASAGFVCFFLPSAWTYYRRSAQYRRGEIPE